MPWRRTTWSVKRHGFAFPTESDSVTAPTAAAILEQLADKDAQVLNLLALCRTPPYLHVWSEGPELLRRFARLLLKQGHPTLALEVAARGLAEKLYPNDPDLLYCRALALARSGNPTRAACFVQEMLGRPDLPPGAPQRRPQPGRTHPQGHGRVAPPTRPSGSPGSAKPSASTNKRSN